MTTEIEMSLTPLTVGDGCTVALVDRLTCSICGQLVEVDGLGLLADGETLTSESAAAVSALNALWIANRRTHGLCGHVVTIKGPEPLYECESPSSDLPSWWVDVNAWLRRGNAGRGWNDYEADRRNRGLPRAVPKGR